jgi:hypothetical protein
LSTRATALAEWESATGGHVQSGEILTDVLVLNVSSGLLLGLDDILTLLDQVLQEEFGGSGDGKGGVVRAVGNVVVGVDDLLDSGDCEAGQTTR